MKSYAVFVAIAAALSSCAASSAMRVSQNEVIIKTRAAPICGDVGAMKVAQKQAAIETIKNGFDRYVIVGEQARDTTQVVQMPGSYQTLGTATYGGGFGSYSATTTYQPGPTLVTGGHHEDLGVRMFKTGDAGYEQAIDARSILGPKWAEIVKDGQFTCAGA
jgi:hypothetical protein